MNEVWLVILPLIAGYLLDLAFGDPRTIPHPVVGFGNMISWQNGISIAADSGNGKGLSWHCRFLCLSV